MAIQNLAFPELLRYPNWGNTESGGLGVSTLTLDASGEWGGYVITAPKTGSITKVHFGVSTSTVSGDVDVRLESVNDATGLPSGTLFGTDTNKVITVSSAGLQTATLTSPASVTQGENIAMFIEADSTSTPTCTLIRFSDAGPQFPYYIYDFGTPTKASTQDSIVIWVEYSDGTQPTIPWVRRIISSTSNFAIVVDRRYGMRFQLPFDAVISGFWSQNNYSDNATNTVEIYGSNGVTVEKTATVNGNILQTNSPCPAYHLFSTDFNAKARTWYRLTWRIATSVGTPYRIVFDIPDLTETTQFGGNDFITDGLNLTQPVHYTYTAGTTAPTKESDWVNNFNQGIAMGLLISEISEWVNPDYAHLRRGRRSR